MLISRGHAVGSIHWGQLAKLRAAQEEREEAEAWAQAQADAEPGLDPEPVVAPEPEPELVVAKTEEVEPNKAAPTPLEAKRGPGRPRKDAS